MRQCIVACARAHRDDGEYYENLFILDILLRSEHTHALQKIHPPIIIFSVNARMAIATTDHATGQTKPIKRSGKLTTHMVFATSFPLIPISPAQMDQVASRKGKPVAITQCRIIPVM